MTLIPVTTTKPEAVQRLLDHLQSLPPQRFEMGLWFTENPQSGWNWSCGTSACMAGWAAVIELGEPPKDVSVCAITDWYAAHFDADFSGFAHLGRKLLGLDSSELFYTESWPKSLKRSGGRQAQLNGAVKLLQGLLAGKLFVDEHRILVLQQAGG